MVVLYCKQKTLGGAYSAAEGKFIFGERIKIMIKHLPPMGWNTWNTFAQNISEELILQSADAMVETGLKDEGYEYIVIDDCWALRETRQSGKSRSRSREIPARHEICRRLHTLQRAQIRNVFLLRHDDLREVPRKL